MSAPTPTLIKLSKDKGMLDVHFIDDQFRFSAEFLRVLSPSAEVQGHSPETAVLQVGKESVRINNIEPVGHYAIRILFDDDHSTGIFSWDTLLDYGRNQQKLWQQYQQKLSEKSPKCAQYRPL